MTHNAEKGVCDGCQKRPCVCETVVLPSAEKEVPRCQATTERGTPCQKRLHASSDGEFWPHAGGHWFMSDDMYACLSDDHYDPVSVLTHGPLAHLDVPCPRAFPPAKTEGDQ